MYIQFFIVPILFVFGQESSKCTSKKTCRDCIQEFNCFWCITPIQINQTNGDDKAPIRCIHKSENISCQNIVSPDSETSTLKNDSFSSSQTNPIQLKPQRIKLSIRKSEAVDIAFQYKQADNYPVDLYYIMDLSNSMEKFKTRLGELGVKLANTLKNITTNVKLGFGSFIDKVELPFVSTAPNKLKEPCPNCVPPYSFKNHLKLTNTYRDFEKQVTDAKVSGNLDSPEGGLDAIMQAIVCKNEIGWRSQARHLLVFSTDAEFHIAGDGKLAGVIEPNDAKCHLSKNEYTEFLKFDYPSVSQINYVAKENNINIIFAIVKKKQDYVTQSYQQLSNRIENSNFGELYSDSNDDSVINLVVNNYNKIVQSVTLSHNATEDVSIKFASQCNNSKSDGCSNVHVGEIVSFTATIKPLKCPESGSTKQVIAIKPDALEESLIIELDVICDCPCSSPNDTTYQTNSKECSDIGDLQCGICKCPSEKFGRNCHCDNQSSVSDDMTIHNCVMNGDSEMCSATIKPLKCPESGSTKQVIAIKPDALEESLIIELDVICDCPCSSPNDTTYQTNSKECSDIGDLQCGICKCPSEKFGRNCHCDNQSSVSDDMTIHNCVMNGDSEMCSGLGECICGECHCNGRSTATEKIYGTFCECDNYSCTKDKGKLCSGRGVCDCKICKCHAGYSGDACQCEDSVKGCIAPGSDKICSGNGKCVCGKCECNVTDLYGEHCNECATCPSQRCEELRHCVECQAYKTGIFDKSECELNCTAFTTVEKFDDENNDDVKKCRVPDKMGCIIIFEYTYDNEKNLIVRAQKEKLCADPPNILAWILGVIGTILLAGIILLIVWKVCTSIHDRREYAKFENERKGLKWHRNDNPLYKEATSTFANPVYNRSSRLSSK